VADSDILRGAILAAAGNTLGSTQDQVHALKRKQLRDRIDEKRARRAERAENQQSAEDFLAENTRRFESKGSFVEQERYPDPYGIPVSPKDIELDTSLRDEQAFDQQRGVRVFKDSGRGRQEYWRESGEDKTGKWTRGNLYGDKKFVPGRVGNDTGIRPDLASRKTENIATAPQGAGMGGPKGLATKLADMVARGEVDPGALVPGSSTKTIGTLLQEMAMTADPALAIEADRRIAAQTAERNNARFSPAVRAINDVIAQRKAEVMPQVSPAAQVNLAGIGNIQNLGIASKKFNRGSNMSLFSVIPNADGDVMDRDGGIDQMAAYVTEIGEDLPEGRVPQMSGTDIEARVGVGVGSQNLIDAIRMIGPDGRTVGYADGQGQWIADVDLGSQAPLTKTQQWLEASLPDMGRQGGTSFGYPQVNIGDELALLNQRLGANAPIGGIRSIEDLENTFVDIVDTRLDDGGKLVNYAPDRGLVSAQGKAVVIPDPGIDEVLYSLNYTANEKQRLANALMQLEAAKRSPVNQGSKLLYDERRYNPRGQFVSNNFDRDVKLSRVTSETYGRDNKKTGETRKSVRSGLKEIDASPERVFKDRDPSTIYAITPDGQRVLLPDAQQDLIDAKIAQSDAPKPFQAAIAGELRDQKNNRDPERARFITNTERNPKVYKMTNEERIKAFGPSGGEVANEVIRRAIEDKQLRTVAAKRQDPIAEEFRARDAKFKAAGQARNAADNAREVNEAFERMGMSLEGKGQMLLGEQIVPDSRSLPPAPYRVESRIPGFTENVPDRNVVPQGPLQAGMTVGERKLLDLGIGQHSQQATSAAVNPTPDPIPLAARGGWMGGDNKGAVVNPWSGRSAPSQRTMESDPWESAPATGNGISNEIKKRASSQRNVPLLSASPPSKEYTSGGGFKADGPNSYRTNVRSEADYRQSVRNLGRVRGYGRNAAIAGGAVAGLVGLDALIGGERNKREQEQYQ